MDKTKKTIFFLYMFLGLSVLFANKTNIFAAKTYNVNIYNISGTHLERKYTVKYGTKITLPSIYAQNGKTLLGYSLKKNQHTNPTYLVGKTITIKNNMNLYNVIFYSQNEEDIPAKSLYGINNVPYKNVIFIGDSRTRRLFNDELTASKYPALHDHIYNIALGCSGFTYLKTTAYQNLINLLKTLNHEKTAIVFNHGVNDLFNCNKYISFMRTIAPTLKKYNCKLFYMSVNPISLANKLYWNKQNNRIKTSKTEQKVLMFNNNIKSKLCGKNKNYTYIDTFSYLNNNGYSFYFDMETSAYNDGLHYTAKTYKRIYQYAMKFLKNN